jgi:GTPase SAR1 family protein
MWFPVTELVGKVFRFGNLKNIFCMEIRLKFSQLSLKFDKKELFKNLFDFNWGTFLTETVEIKSPLELKAFLLLFKTAQQTYLALSKQIGQENLNKKDNLFIINQDVEKELIDFFEQEVVIKKEFFEDLLNFNADYLSKTYSILERYFKMLEIDIPYQLNFDYYKSYRHNLQIEYQGSKDFYRELHEYFDNPLFVENKKFEKRLEYYKNIKLFFTNKIQSEVDESKETLKDLYIEPYFDIYKNNYLYSDDEVYEFTPLRNDLTIHNFIENYFLKGEKFPECRESYNMLFILGQPGQGKTSFCYKLIYDYLDRAKDLPKTPIYFLKIRELIAQDFVNNPFQSINNHLNENIDFQSENCILVLDGLDEAFMSGGLNDHDLRNLYDRLNKTAQHAANLKIILTSRFNYLKISDSCIDKSLVIQLRVLSNEQIKTYCDKFKAFYPKNAFLTKIDLILRDKKFKHIKELLQQAVLIYFIAISDIDIEENDSTSRIYDKIFSTLTKRSWDNKKQLDYVKPELRDNSKNFERYLREFIRSIAFEIYQSPHLYITLEHLQELDASKKFISRCFDESLTSDPDRIKEISKYLLISFYFQESKNNKTTETAIEFFHNSLWEYLTAEYIWEENKNLLMQLDQYQDIIVKTKLDYFKFLDRVIGQKKFSNTVRLNLEDIIINDKKEINKTISDATTKLFIGLLEDDFLLEYRRNENVLTSLSKGTNIFELCWTFYYYSNFNSEKRINADYYLNKYLFTYSYIFYSEYVFKNIDFTETVYTNVLERNTFNSVNFRECVFELTFISNSFNNSSFFGGVFSLGSMFSNVYTDVHFKNCSFFPQMIVQNNHFINCKFEKVKIPGKMWFKNFLKENYFADEITDNFSVTSRKVKNYNNKIETRYYLNSNNL